MPFWNRKSEKTTEEKKLQEAWSKEEARRWEILREEARQMRAHTQAMEGLCRQQNELFRRIAEAAEKLVKPNV